MTGAEVMAELIKQAPSTAAIIIVVVLFLRYLDKWMTDWRAFLSAQQVSSTAAIEKLASLLKIHDDETKVAIATMMERTRPVRTRKTAAKENG